MNISASLVLFHNDPIQYGQAIRCFLDGCEGILFVVDNSTTPLQHELFAHPRVHYVYAGENLGFGKAHNRAIAMVGRTSDAHLLLNPDISFNAHVLPELGQFLGANHYVGAVMPRITYPDGSLQRLCKLLPTPVDLILRRFVPSKRIKAKINERYELHGLTQDRPSCVPSLSGCFLLIRTELLSRVGGFDERFFMYMEDVDLVRRIGDIAETLYLPSVQVVHAYAKGSYLNRRLLGYHMRSAIEYFNKWGWFFDPTRKIRNRNALDIILTRY
jgi:GT2 family glycosyltransferase